MSREPVPPITSAANPAIKAARKLDRRARRSATGSCRVEGEDLLYEACVAGCVPTEVFVAESLSESQSWTELVRVIPHETAVRVVDDRLIATMSDMGHPARVVAVLPIPAKVNVADIDQGVSVIPVLDGLRDPGNVGTVIRSARAFGSPAVIAGPHTADRWSPRAMRAAMGASFHVADLSYTTLPEIADELGATVVALAADGAADISEMRSIRGRIVLGVGSERTGISAALAEAADHVFRIPIEPGTDSINAAMAATIGLYVAGGRP